MQLLTPPLHHQLHCGRGRHGQRTVPPARSSNCCRAGLGAVSEISGECGVRPATNRPGASRPKDGSGRRNSCQTPDKSQHRDWKPCARNEPGSLLLRLHPSKAHRLPKDSMEAGDLPPFLGLAPMANGHHKMCDGGGRYGWSR